MEIFEEESSESSSSSDVQASGQFACNSSPEKVQVVSPSTNTIITHKKKAGRKKFRETRHPIFRGVRERNGGKWVCEVREPNKKSRIWLGTFPCPDMAARAYDVAAIALRGKSAPLNFSDSAWLLPRAKSSSPRDIQLAALQAAESFRPDPHAATTTTTCSPSSSSSTTTTTATELPLVNEEKEGLRAEASTATETEAQGRRAVAAESEFVDEEALFNMPALLDSMAEGMLLTPPSMKQRFNWDDVDLHLDLSLWSDLDSTLQNQ